MTIQAAPQPQPFNSVRDFTINRNFLDSKRLDTLLKSVEKLELQDSDMGSDPMTGVKFVQAKECVILRDDEFGWLYDDVQEFVTSCNERFYGFNIQGFEHFKYMVYDEIGSHHKNRIDAGEMIESSSQRKLGFVLQLSDQDSYEGGDFEFFRVADIYQPIPRNAGCIALYSSFAPYRVQPIIKGKRQCIVGWVYGPPFC